MDTIIETIATELESLTWNVGALISTANFSKVYRARVYGDINNTPYACVDESENGANTSKVATRGGNGSTVYQKNQAVSIYIISYANDILTVEESTKRLRYATEAVETYLINGIKLKDVATGWNYTGWNAIENEQAQLIGRKMDIILINTV